MDLMMPIIDCPIAINTIRIIIEIAQICADDDIKVNGLSSVMC